MEYARIVVIETKTNREISRSMVMPKAMVNLFYLELMISEAGKIMDGFSITKIEDAPEKEFNLENFMLLLKFKNHEITEEEYHSRLK